MCCPTKHVLLGCLACIWQCSLWGLFEASVCILTVSLRPASVPIWFSAWQPLLEMLYGRVLLAVVVIVSFLRTSAQMPESLSLSELNGTRCPSVYPFLSPSVFPSQPAEFKLVGRLLWPASFTVHSVAKRTGKMMRVRTLTYYGSLLPSNSRIQLTAASSDHSPTVFRPCHTAVCAGILLADRRVFSFSFYVYFVLRFCSFFVHFASKALFHRSHSYTQTQTFSAMEIGRMASLAESGYLAWTHILYKTRLLTTHSHTNSAFVCYSSLSSFSHYCYLRLA